MTILNFWIKWEIEFLGLKWASHRPKWKPVLSKLVPLSLGFRPLELLIVTNIYISLKNEGKKPCRFWSIPAPIRFPPSHPGDPKTLTMVGFQPFLLFDLSFLTSSFFNGAASASFRRMWKPMFQWLDNSQRRGPSRSLASVVSIWMLCSTCPPMSSSSSSLPVHAEGCYNWMCTELVLSCPFLFTFFSMILV